MLSLMGLSSAGTVLREALKIPQNDLIGLLLINASNYRRTSLRLHYILFR